MIIRHQFSLIYILCCAATIYGSLLDANDAETCNLLCVQCNASAVFANGHCECNFADDIDKVSGAECVQRVQREIQDFELNILSEDLTDEERNVRSILKYRRRLRPEAVPYGIPTMHGIQTYSPALGAINPDLISPTGGYDPTSPIGAIHPHGLPLHHALVRAVTLPGHVLHHILHPRVLHHYPLHGGIVRSTNSPQDQSGFVGQSCETNDASTTSNARNNADKPEQNRLADLVQSPVTWLANALHQPIAPSQYQHVPSYQYQNPYYSPLMSILQPVTNGYILQPVSHYTQDTTDQLVSATNPHSYCDNNANTQQRSAVSTADKTAHPDDTEKSNDRNKNIIDTSKKTENGTDKS
ncbi:uncharacterized protein LOC105422622 isoform X3 [Pogonomyrmex barbatus]|uniref:Uncharacterized protein LOC105422622 isoform X3 n=1 Tax=Pogonomyrmex barbatus TaxID=144034 RepID=A0A6I9VP11_9HYME|nr:uncharacterized protein LOC105422622 isoform X3 [Pogonomyrmex barbatus]